MHMVYHEFCKKFKDASGKFKKIGYPLMIAVEKWVPKFPKQVFLTSCDDACFASSDLVIIEHCNKKDYMGATVIFIPQCTREQPIEFFLYPHSRKDLIGILKKLGSKLC